MTGTVTEIEALENIAAALERLEEQVARLRREVIEQREDTRGLWMAWRQGALLTNAKVERVLGLRKK